MAGRRLIAIGVGVLLLHAFALDWLAGELAYSTVLKPMAEPMFTRLLQPEPPKAPAAPARRSAAPRSVPPGVVSAQLTRPPQAPASAPQPAAEAPPAFDEAMAQAAAALEPPAGGPDPALEEAIALAEPSAQASEAAAEANALAARELWLKTWPADTRLSYRLGGHFRDGPLYGQAQVQWQREGSDYQVRVEVDVTVWAHLSMTSQGELTADGLFPRAYEEVRRGKRRAAQFGERSLDLERGRSAPRPEGLQDTASQFVELAHRFATGRERLEVGRSISFWMARPGDVDRWTYDIVGRELLRSPTLGEIEAFHLKPRAIANPRGKIMAEMWYSPSLQYLPVRIRVSMGEEAQVDLMVEQVEQR